MRYYSRFWAQVCRDFALFEKTQVRVSLGAGVLAAIVAGVVIHQAVWITIVSSGSVLVVYLAILSFRFTCAMICAPVKLDRHRAIRTSALRDASKKRIAAMNRQHATEIQQYRTSIANQDQTITELQKPKRSPAELQKLDFVTKAIAELGPEDLVALRHLHNHGRIVIGQIALPPLPPGMNHIQLSEALGRCAAKQLVTWHDDLTPGLWSKVWEILPGMNSAIEEVLYRPVTPSQD